ncbi:MAG: suppressor of fused domain protein [Solobacterium sp.]|nr:suppressor of fused domain protein [Erysipelotrichaceae bacterium]MBQ9152307.1 suppressor of fused domain protein [Solobacterium sp.]
MGLLDLLKKKKEPEQPVQEKEASTAGWDAITAEFERIYPGQTSPKHYGTIIRWIFGGNDPLDGISIYDGGDFWHFVSYGLTEIYDKETDDREISGYGYELTLKLKKYPFENEEAELKNICGILQMIARITFTKGELFRPFEFMYTGQTEGIDAKQESNLTGFITVSDPSVHAIETPNGRVEFLELIGMTDGELKTLSNKESVRELYEKYGSDLTDYHRESII